MTAILELEWDKYGDGHSEGLTRRRRRRLHRHHHRHRRHHCPGPGPGPRHHCWVANLLEPTPTA